jgi:hypothetical protein
MRGQQVHVAMTEIRMRMTRMKRKMTRSRIMSKSMSKKQLGRSK